MLTLFVVKTLPRAKLAPRVARKVLLEAHRYKASEAFEDGVVDAIAPPERMLDEALALAEKWKAKAKMGVSGHSETNWWVRRLVRIRAIVMYTIDGRQGSRKSSCKM